MGWVNNLRLQPKLMGGFGIVLVLMAVVAYISISKMSAMGERTSYIADVDLTGVEYTLQAETYLADSSKFASGAFTTSDPRVRAARVASARESIAKALDSLGKYKGSIAADEDRKLFGVLEPKVQKVVGDREEVLKFAERGNIDGGAAAHDAMDEEVQDMRTAIQNLVDYNLKMTAADRASAESDASSARTTVLIATAIAVLLGMGIAFYLARRIKNDVALVSGRMASIEQNCLASLEAGIKAVEDGNLLVEARPVTPKIDRYAKDELGDMAATINAMIDKLVNTIGSYNAMREGLRVIVSGVGDNAASILTASDQLQEASDQMAAATGQIATAINEVTRSTVSLSSLSQESSKEIEQVAAGSQELAANARANTGSATTSRDEALRMGEQIAQVAKQSEAVANTANESRQAAVEGQRAVRQAVSSMESIAGAVERTSKTVDQLGEYGQQIGDIVKVIDEIAAQTNLLALNAAIEAARAGEQGRGFAVVADNVRSLAERSSQSTKEIADLISKVQSGTREAVEAMALGVKDVNDGRAITSEAGQALDAIIESVQTAAAQMQAIARDVQALSAGAETIVGGAEEIARNAEIASTSAATMADATGRVTEAILQVSATSEQTSASAEEVSASTEELSAQSEELAATAQAMKELAERLNAAANRFTWEERDANRPVALERRHQADAA